MSIADASDVVRHPTRIGQRLSRHRWTRSLLSTTRSAGWQNEIYRVILFERKPIPDYRLRTGITVEFIANLCGRKSLSTPLRSMQPRAWKMEYSGNKLISSSLRIRYSIHWKKGRKYIRSGSSLAFADTPHSTTCMYILILWTWDSRFHGRIDWTGNARYREKSLHPREMRLLLSLGFAAV